jgi:hypothetical protein
MKYMVIILKPGSGGRIRFPRARAVAALRQGTPASDAGLAAGTDLR